MRKRRADTQMDRETNEEATTEDRPTDKQMDIKKHCLLPGPHTTSEDESES